MPREIRIHGDSGTQPSQMLDGDGKGDPQRVTSHIDTDGELAARSTLGRTAPTRLTRSYDDVLALSP